MRRWRFKSLTPRKAQDANPPIGPGDVPFDATYKQPRALTTGEAWDLVCKFGDATRRAVAAGVDTIELHGAHGYLIHQFQSPNSNKRTDEFGQDLSRFGVEVVKAVKNAMPADMPLIMRISAVEYAEGGYDIDYAIDLCRKYRDAGVDMFDVSSGGDGVSAGRKPGNFPGYHVPLAVAIKRR